MGILAAVEYWATERDEVSEYRTMIRQLETVSGRVTRIDGVTTEILEPTPRLQITWPLGWIHGLDLRQELLEREPRIMLDDRGATETSVFILPFSLQEGEAEARCCGDRQTGKRLCRRLWKQPNSKIRLRRDLHSRMGNERWCERRV